MGAKQYRHSTRRLCKNPRDSRYRGICAGTIGSGAGTIGSDTWICTSGSISMGTLTGTWDTLGMGAIGSDGWALFGAGRRIYRELYNFITHFDKACVVR